MLHNQLFSSAVLPPPPRVLVYENLSMIEMRNCQNDINKLLYFKFRINIIYIHYIIFL